MNLNPTLPRSVLLLVESNNKTLDTLRTMFGQQYIIEVAEDGQQALNLVYELDIDLILSAVEIPIISGLELCKRVNNNPLTQHIPVIFLASAASIEEEQMCLEIGAIDYINQFATPQIIHARIINHMRLVEQQKVFEYVSCTDGLTGLANRMQLDTTLNRVWHAAIRAGYSIGLLMIDIDHFKDYNDQYGHIEGDECLKLVATTIASSKGREEDFAARFGGEEFVLLLPYTDLVGAKRVARQLIKNIQNLNIPAAKSANAEQVTVSVGVAAISPKFNPLQNSSPLELINQADINLFKAKRAGRNRIC
ncbi:diguanylate cyclase [Paraglaciecola sp. 25GB23A]|uniref:diguanylate cyclase n=1 Tax=Paraglaciecola sp. 25GB23A TaxID=3156068 RepID=UPI0032AF56E7|tara:strand:- start:5802 stop:6722 length:921 start_codon:yes stop_codon:yes gene_type:complete